MSLIVSTPAATPTVSENVAVLSDVTTIELINAAEPPETVNSVAAVSWVQSVFVPVAVIDGTVPVRPLGGESVNEAFATAIVVVRVPSEIMQDPAVLTVVTTRVTEIVELIVCETFWTPDPFTVNVWATQLVPIPFRVSVMCPEWLAGITDGVTDMEAPAGALKAMAPMPGPAPGHEFPAASAGEVSLE